VHGSGGALLTAGPRRVGTPLPLAGPCSLLLLVLAWLAPWSLAAAAPGEVTVSLELDGQPEQPAWVCVASRAKGRAQVDAGVLRERVDGRGEVLATAAADPPERARAGHGALEDAFAAMRPVPAEPHCGQQADGGEACAPRVSVELDEHRYVACTANERQVGRSPEHRSRVLWLAISTRDSLGAPAAVERLSLNGAVLTLTTNLRGDEAITVVQTIGGHYRAEGDVRIRGARAATLLLEPLCRWVPVRVPPIQLPSGDQADPRPAFTLEDDGHSMVVPPACVRGSLADETLEVRVPYYESSAVPSERRGMRLRAKIDQTVPRELPWRSPSDAAADEEGAVSPRREVVVIQQAAMHHDEEQLDVAPVPASEPAALAPEPFAIDLSARWSGAWPSEARSGDPASSSSTASMALSLAPEVVTFFWPRDACFYSEGCPEARLASSARTCEPYPRSDGCYYRCEVGRMEVGVVGEAFRVPITFTDLTHGSPRPEWGATLDHLNQRFLRSMPAEQRRVRVDLGAWSRGFVPAQDGGAIRRTRGPSYGEVLADTGPDVRRRAQRNMPEAYEDPGPIVTTKGDAIRAISFGGAFGNVHRIELGRGEHREYYFELPQARCGETVHVEIEGDRQYRAADVPLRAGTLVLEHPLGLGRVLYFGTGLSLGFTRVLSPADARSASGWTPAAAIDLSLRFRPRRAWRAWRFELPRVSYMLATQPYSPLGPDPDQAAPKLPRALWSRFLVAALARTPDVPRIDIVKLSVAFGLGLDVGAPVRSSDIDAVGEVHVGLVPLAELLVRMSPRLELRVIEPRLYCLEGFHRHLTGLQGVAREDVARGRMCTLFLGAGVAGTW
jgi:hypothetical protein